MFLSKMTYQEFLESKIELAQDSGFEVNPADINKALKPHQRDAVIWALKGGRRALFESFGLGKTIQEIEFCKQVIDHEGGRALIVLPLGVKQEFTQDAVDVLGYDAPVYCRSMEEVESCDSSIVLTNYERVRDGDIRPDYFVATSLDEASVLRSFGSKTYQTFLDKFKNVPYKLVATATPSPNKYKELIHYAGYLEIMDTGQALTRFFQRDSTKANNLTLYPNMEDEFWLWVSSWALFITKPSDVNPEYSDDGYVLPPLDVRWHEIPIHYGDTSDKTGQMQLFTEAAAGLKEAAEVKRNSIDQRVEKMKEIVESSPEEHFLLWHDLESERKAILKAIPEVVDIYGSQDYDLREKRVIDFAQGRIKLFATKKSISGSGCNFQRYCHREIFLGIDYEFNDFIQAVHRCYRFLQTDTVVIDIIYMENERQIKEALLEKWKNHNHMVKKMTDIVKKYGLSPASKIKRLERKMGVETVKVQGKHYTAVNDDCVEECRRIESNSVGAPTMRKRFFMVARCDKRPIIWPEPTHAPADSEAVKEGLLKPYVGAYTQIDFSRPCPSIFDTSEQIKEKYGIKAVRPLAPKTMERIARGLKKFVLDNPEPFIVPIGYGERTGQLPRIHDINKPLPTIVGSGKHYLCAPTLIQYHSETVNGEVRGQTIDNPVMTIDGSNRYGLVLSSLIQMNNHCDGRNIKKPLPTITAGDGHFGEVRAFLVKYYGDATGQDIKHPLDTITTKDRFGLVTIEGTDYQIVDIGLRMLEPRELYGCQGFPSDYIIDHDYTGKTYPRAEQVKRCGNSVSPMVPNALVRANLKELCIAQRMPNCSINEEKTGQLRFA